MMTRVVVKYVAGYFSADPELDYDGRLNPKSTRMEWMDLEVDTDSTP